MQKLDISEICKVFAVKKVKIMNDLKDKSSIFYLPDGFICYADDEHGPVSFEKFIVNFEVFEDKECFTVCVDDTWFIGKDFKLTDDENLKAHFGKVAKGKNGDIEYSSIHARVSKVYVALCEGKIRIGDINSEED